MNFGDKYLENQILTGNPVVVTILIYENILQKLDYIVLHFDESDKESFESELSLEKLDKVERLIEELHMQVATLEERPFPTMAQTYRDIMDGIFLFRQNHDKDILTNIMKVIIGMKDAYQEVARRDV